MDKGSVDCDCLLTDFGEFHLTDISVGHCKVEIPPEACCRSALGPEAHASHVPHPPFGNPSFGAQFPGIQQFPLLLRLRRILQFLDHEFGRVAAVTQVTSTARLYHLQV